MSRLEVRLLGEFDVRVDDQGIYEFESQKVRGLLAYLVMHRGHAISRDRLATLLWAGKPDGAARRNLRQALHNLRSAFSVIIDPDQVLTASHQSLQLSQNLECWLDVERFEEATRRGRGESGPDPYQLSVAASLYAGDFLTGFFVKDSPPFEEWMLTEQERLREAAIDSYRALIETYIRRREHRLGIQFARRLLAIDPLSEEAHRSLMRLYALSGRRARALRQYEILRNLLRSELEVEPLAETQSLRRSILAHDVQPTGAEEPEGPVGPLIPLAARDDVHRQLETSWRSVLSGSGRVTVLEGEAGIGKTRMARSFMDTVTQRSDVIVLQGRSYAGAPPASYRLFGELLVSALEDLLPEESAELLAHLTPETLGDLGAMAPSLSRLGSEALEIYVELPRAEPARFGQSWLDLLDALHRYSGRRRHSSPVILFLDDLQWCDRGSRFLLEHLLPGIAERTVWILATVDSDSAPEEFSTSDIQQAKHGDAVPIDRIPLERLGPNHLKEIASSLVGPASSEVLAEYLHRQSDGLPLAVAESINLLWDRGQLMPRGAGRWTLRGRPENDHSPGGLSELIRLRVRRLPTSARRLLAVAATIGPRFDVELLQKAAGEHLAVVDTCLQLMLERWLIRLSPSTWSPSQRERDLQLWAQGIRRGWFEFSHERTRSAILSDIRPKRRSILHRSVASAMRETQSDDLEAACEALAHHELAAGNPGAALPLLETAARRAQALGAIDTADWYHDRYLTVLQELSDKAKTEADREKLAAKRRDLERDLSLKA